MPFKFSSLFININAILSNYESCILFTWLKFLFIAKLLDRKIRRLLFLGSLYFIPVEVARYFKTKEDETSLFQK
jgi:hypothetical protein